MSNINRDSRLQEIEQRISDITVDLVFPIMESKTVDVKLFNEFFELLDQLGSLQSNMDYLPKSLVSNLMKIYFLLDGEYKHSREPVKAVLGELVSKFQGQLFTIFNI